jgi:hypothetical protein
MLVCLTASGGMSQPVRKLGTAKTRLKEGEKMVYDERLLEYLKKELHDHNGDAFQNFVSNLLDQGVGPRQWAPTEGPDGKIDYAGGDILFQMYGAKSQHGAASKLREKVNEVELMKKTAADHELPYTRIIILTNVILTEHTERLKKKAQAMGAELFDLHDSACYLYPWYFPFDQLRQYHEDKCGQLADEKWPYAIDESVFVESFDYHVGSIQKRQPTDAVHCVPFLKGQLAHGAALCIGYYGMGKSTIAKYLFRHWDLKASDVYPVFLSLSDAHLSEHLDGTIGHTILKQLCSRQSGPQPFRNPNLDALNLRRMLDTRGIALLFDGIDEAIIHKGELRDFARFLSDLPCSVLVTCRLEFGPFFNAFLNDGDWHHPDYQCVELREWGTPQWDVYTDALKAKHSSKAARIDVLRQNLSQFGELPRRPLFLKMLSDLHVENQHGVALSEKEELRTNRAEIYVKFLVWRLLDDWERRSQDRDIPPEPFKREGFELLIQIAAQEYSRQESPLEAFAAMVAGRPTPPTENASSGVRLHVIENLCEDMRFVYLTRENIRSYLTTSALFATLRSIDETDAFTFSHRSFMEYLVAFQLADGIFCGQRAIDEPRRWGDGPRTRNAGSAQPTRLTAPDKAACLPIWKFYQTHEVSALFMNEVARITCEMDLKEEERNRYLATAFAPVLADLLPGGKYEQRVEEALFYVGRFRVRDERLVTKLQQVLHDPQRYDRVYYRTASLAMAELEGPKPCADYVLSLLDSFDGDRKAFDLNNLIQSYYYGIDRIRPTLAPIIDAYITGGKLDSLVAHRALTYFVSAPAFGEEKRKMLETLEAAKTAAKNRQDSDMMKILAGVERILQIGNSPCARD